MTSTTNSDSTNSNQQLYAIVSTIIVSLMMACLGITLVLFVSKLVPGMSANYLPILGFLFALEQLSSFKKTKRFLIFSRSWFIYQFTQWVFILLVLKIVLLIAKPPESFRLIIQLWQLDFFTYFFDSDYIFAVIFILVIWIVCGYFAILLDEMSLKELLIKYETISVAPIYKPPVRERLLGLIFALGFIQVMLTALLRINLRMLLAGDLKNLAVQPLPYLAAGAWNVLLYFLLGLVLMSISQFTRLNARWHFQKIEITPQLGMRWATYSILFIVFLSVVASLLPTDYSLGFLSVLGYIIRYIVDFLLYIFGFIFSLVIVFFNLLLSLMGLTPQSQVSLPSREFSSPEPPMDTDASTVYPWLEVVKSLLFWMVFLGVIGFSVYQFFRQHEGIWSAIHRTPGFSWLTRIFQWLLGGFRRVNKRLFQAVEVRIQRFRRRREKSFLSKVPRFLNLRKLSPRQRVYFFFMAMIRRGGESGIRRQESQTPYEYAGRLEGRIPDVDHDVNSLTTAFVEARYSQRDIDEDEAGLVKRSWEKIRSALRSIGK